MVLRVLHLVGSSVDDFHVELSSLYARDCLTALADPDRYEMRLAYVTPDGCWRFPADLGAPALATAAPLPVADAVAVIAELGVDVMVPHLFDLPGMTAYRALFDVLGIPYVGNPPGVMALAADKARTRAVVAGRGVRVPPGEVLRRGDRPTLAPPVVVKPVDSDNSRGVALVRSASEYDGALAGAFAVADEVLVETYVELGREVRCGVVVRDGELVCLPLEEYAVDPASKPIRTYEDKLAPDAAGDLRLVAKDATHAWIVDRDDPVTERVWAAARACHVALGCRHYSLFDFRIDPDGEPWFLEAGLYSSFAHQSVIPTMARAAGLPVDRLFADALAELHL